VQDRSEAAATFKQFGHFHRAAPPKRRQMVFITSISPPPC